MKWDITGGSAFPVLKFELDKDESIKSQAGAMVAVGGGLTLEGKVDGGVMKAIGRMFSGESFFMQHVVADKAPGWALLASPAPGSITDIEIRPGVELTVQKSGFLAGTSGVEVSSKVQSLARGFFSGEGFFVVKLTGAGTAFLSTYGAAQTIDIPAGESVAIDNGYLIAWESSLPYEITKAASSWFSAFTTGSGFVCRFTGPGQVIVQTRNPWSFARWLGEYLPRPTKNSQ